MSEELKNVSLEQQEEQTVVEEPKKTRKKPHVSLDILKCALVLVLIATVAGVLLGVINWVTYVDPEKAIKEKVGALYGVSADSVKNVTNEYPDKELGKSSVNAVYRVNDEITAFYVTASGAYDGTVEYVVCVKDGKVDNIIVYSSGETASIGGNVLKQDNLDKYKGTVLASVELVEAGSKDAKASDVYISGATKTTKSVVNAIRVTAKAYLSKGGENA